MRCAVYLLAWALAMTSACVLAGPPYVTDDPETPALHGWEINVPFDRTITSGIAQADEPLFDINYGYLANLQLKVEFPIAGIKGTGIASARGWGDVLVGPKWRFQEEKKRIPQIAVYPQVLIPTGSASCGLGAGKPAYYLPLLAEKNWGSWTCFSNVGYVVQTAADTRDYWYYGLALTNELNRRLVLGAEIFGNTSTDVSSPDFVGYNFGAEWELTKNCNLLVSAGHSIAGEPTSMLYLGLQFEVASRRHHRERAVRHSQSAASTSGP